jgi:hypothetical protein
MEKDEVKEIMKLRDYALNQPWGEYFDRLPEVGIGMGISTLALSMTPPQYFLPCTVGLALIALCIICLCFFRLVILAERSTFDWLMFSR